MAKEDLIQRITNYSSKVVTRETVESIVYAMGTVVGAELIREGTALLPGLGKLIVRENTEKPDQIAAKNDSAPAFTEKDVILMTSIEFETRLNKIL
ncbi:hypothetical protein CE91St38_18270 [Desulfovibrionaceae bacterium]|nr:hypothetical protein CE91St38_18270 [Desulfovibrionaceae bacterium]GKI12369.1 hypothetical protein CE91St39_18230 [Desulfovibrionaceae bacterium]